VPASRDDLQAIARYGEQAPDDYGGVHIDGSEVVVHFVQDHERHIAALREFVSSPDRLRAVSTTRSWRHVMSARDEVSGSLLSDPALGVTSVGIALRGGQFAIVVGIDPYSPERVAAVHRAIDHEVVVEAQGPVRLA